MQEYALQCSQVPLPHTMSLRLGLLEQSNAQAPAMTLICLFSSTAAGLASSSLKGSHYFIIQVFWRLNIFCKSSCYLTPKQVPELPRPASEATMKKAAPGAVVVHLAICRPRRKAFGVGRWKFFHTLHRLQDVPSSLQHVAALPDPANSSWGFRVNIQVLCLQRFVTVKCQGDTKIDKLNSVKEILLYTKVLCLQEIFVPCMTTMGEVRGMDIHDWSIDIYTICVWNV